MSAAEVKSVVGGPSPTKDTKVLPLEPKVEAALKVDTAAKESLDSLKVLVAQLTEALKESKKKVSQLEGEKSAKATNVASSALGPFLERQVKASQDLDSRIQTVATTTAANPITPSLALFTASFGSLEKDAVTLKTTWEKIEEESAKIALRSSLLQWGAKVETFIQSVETLKGKIQVPTKESVAEWTLEVTALKAAFEELKEGKDLASNALLSVKLIPLWNKAVLEFHRLEKTLVLKTGELLVAQSATILKELNDLKGIAKGHLVQLSPATYDPKNVESLFPMEKFRALTEGKRSHKEEAKRYKESKELSNELYYLSRLTVPYLGESAPLVESHRDMLGAVIKEADAIKKKLQEELTLILTVADEVGTTLDRIFEKANNKGAVAAWLSGGNIFKYAFLMPEKYFATAEAKVAELFKAVAAASQ